MKTAKELFLEKRAETVIKNLKKRNFEAWYCATGEEACKKALTLIPEGSSISWGGSVTIRETGLTRAVSEGPYTVYDRDLEETPEGKRKICLQAFSCGTYLTGCNAISEDGQLVNIDGNGNRVAALIYGPDQVIMLVGMNKVVKTKEDAVSRARNEAAPQNQQRFLGKTPCTASGTCHDCTSEECICNQIVITRNCRPAGRIKIILIGEELGY